MKCDEIKRQLALYAGGDLPENEIPGIEAHLSACAECAAELKALKETHNAFLNINIQDTPQPLPEAFFQGIYRNLEKKEKLQTFHFLKGLHWLLKKPALVSYAVILAFFLGAGLSYKYWEKAYKDAIIEYTVVDPVFEKIEAKLGKKISYQMYTGSMLPQLETIARQPVVFIVMHKKATPDGAETFSIDYLGESGDLLSVERYPWFEQRKKELMNKAGSPDNIYVIISPQPNSSPLERRQIKKLLNSQLKDSLKEGV